jgi:hypothetical protein
MSSFPVESSSKASSTNLIDQTEGDEEPALPKPDFTLDPATDSSTPPSPSPAASDTHSEADSMYEDILDSIADEDFVAGKKY